MERCNLLNILDPIKEFLNYESLISNKYELLKNNYYFQSDRRRYVSQHYYFDAPQHLCADCKAIRPAWQII